MGNAISAGRLRAGLAAAGLAGIAAFTGAAVQGSGVQAPPAPDVALTTAAGGLGDITTALGMIPADEWAGLQTLGMTVFMEVPQGLEMSVLGAGDEVQRAVTDLGQQEFSKAGTALLDIPVAMAFGGLLPFAGFDLAFNQMLVEPVEQIWQAIDPTAATDATSAAAGDDFGVSTIAADLSGLF